MMLSAARELARAITRRRRADPPFEIWLEAEGQYNFRSSFFFLPDRPALETWEDPFYRHSDRIMFEGRRVPVHEVMRALAERGWDVGLHGASASSQDAKRLAAERRSIEHATGRLATTVRQHHLFFDIRHTPHSQTKAGLQADTSLGSNRSIGFRCGTCFPFRLYDSAADAPLDLLEAPLIIQDCALFPLAQLNQWWRERERTLAACQ
jgi:hypothetical protein